MTSTRTIRRYPRDVSTGARVLVRMMTPCGVKAVPGTVAELVKDGARYRIVVDTDNYGRTRLFPAANAKLDTIR